jgi:hypothetical protein
MNTQRGIWIALSLSMILSCAGCGRGNEAQVAGKPVSYWRFKLQGSDYASAASDLAVYAKQLPMSDLNLKVVHDLFRESFHNADRGRSSDKANAMRVILCYRAEDMRYNAADLIPDILAAGASGNATAVVAGECIKVIPSIGISAVPCLLR